MNSERLVELYEECGSISEVARRLGISWPTAKKWLAKAGITDTRSGYRSPRRGPTKRGPEHHNWKGGVHRHSDGYLYEYAPDHPAAPSAKGYVLQHRLVMERKLGRFLTSDEVVHHINEVKDDNRPENLELTNLSQHMQGHKADASRDAHGRFLD